MPTSVMPESGLPAPSGPPPARSRMTPRAILVWTTVALLGAVGSVELVEVIAENGEAGVGTRVDAQLTQVLGRNEQIALLAVVEIGNDVQALHRDTPFKQKICSRGLHTRPRALRFWRGALIPRAAGAVLLAEVYPSEKYRGEKVRKYNRIYLA